MVDAKPSPVAGSNEMVERVARAIARQEMIDSGYHVATAQRFSEGEGWLNFRKQAVVAIAAMRATIEPNK